MKVFCLLSDERAFNSKSPAMFQAVMKRVGIRGMYVPFKVKHQQIGLAAQSLKVLNIDGANVAAPYKEAVIPHLNILSEGANIIGAVNTIVRRGDELKGYNTNAIGFMDALEEIGYDVTGKTALVFGAGGAAKAVVFILNWLRAASIMISCRKEESAQQIVKRIAGEFKPLPSLSQSPLSANIVVNATSVSTPDESPDMARLVRGLDLKDCDLVIDLNYGRRSNFWEEMAKTKQIRFMDGHSILAHQARRCFALWTKIDVEPQEFLNAIHETT